jgi:hypothetical protein
MQVKVPTKDLRDYLRYLIQIRIVFEAREDRQAYDVTFGQTLCWSRPWYACNRGTSGWAHPRSDGRAPPPLLRATPQRSMPTSISTSPPSAPLVSAAKDAPWDQIALHVRCFGRPSLLPCLCPNTVAASRPMAGFCGNRRGRASRSVNRRHVGLQLSKAAHGKVASKKAGEKNAKLDARKPIESKVIE